MASTHSLCSLHIPSPRFNILSAHAHAPTPKCSVMSGRFSTYVEHVCVVNARRRSDGRVRLGPGQGTGRSRWVWGVGRGILLPPLAWYVHIQG